MAFASGKTFAKFRRLSPVNRREVAASFLLLPLFWAGLRTVGFKRLNDWIIRAAIPEEQAVSIEEVDETGLLINAVALKLLGPGTCLTRSMYFLWRLRRRGIRGELKIGMRFVGDQLEAHAWVEVEGQPVNDVKNIAYQYTSFREPLAASVIPST